MINTLETPVLHMDEILTDARHSISKTFLREARLRKLALYDENDVVFSHQEITSVAAPYQINRKDFSKNQALVFLYLKGKTDTQLKDGYYTIQGNLDKKGFDPNNLLLLDAQGREVQQMTLQQQETEYQVEQKGHFEITDAHYIAKDEGPVVQISGKVFNVDFKLEIKLS